MTRKTHNLRRALLKRLLIATISTGLLFAQLVSPANALVSEGETVKGIQNFDIAVNGSSYDFFDLGSLCVEIDGSPLNKFGVDSVTLGGVKFYNFGVSSDFDLSSSGCTHRLWMVEDVESFESVQFRLNTALLSNGDHEVKITIRNDSDTCSGTCIPDAETFFTFSSLNSGSSGPVIYFNSELFNCADCLAIGLPYNLTATFGVSSLGEPVKVSSHLKVKGTWQKYFPAVYKNKKWVLSSITVWGPTWLEVKAQFKNGKSWYYKQLLKPRYRFAVSGPSEVRVGRSATSKLVLPGVSFARCIVEVKFYPDYGRSTVRQYGANLVSGNLYVTGSYSSSGTVDGYATCRVNSEEVIGSFGWDVTYW